MLVLSQQLSLKCGVVDSVFSAIETTCLGLLACTRTAFEQCFHSSRSAEWVMSVQSSSAFLYVPCCTQWSKKIESGLTSNLCQCNWVLLRIARLKHFAAGKQTKRAIEWCRRFCGARDQLQTLYGQLVLSTCVRVVFLFHPKRVKLPL